MFMTRRLWTKINQLFTPKVGPIEAAHIWPTNTKSNSLRLWRTFDDSALGGSSQCTAEVINDSNPSEKFLRFSGKTSALTQRQIDVGIQRTFCAMSHSFRETLDLRDLRCLELVARTTTTSLFTVNMGCASMVSGELFQCSIELSKSEDWKTIQIPFSMFRYPSNFLFASLI